MSWPFTLLLGYCVDKLFFCCHGDGSNGRHVYTKYHGHAHYYQVSVVVLFRNHSVPPGPET